MADGTRVLGSLVVVGLAIYAAVGVVERREKATWAHVAEAQVAAHAPVWTGPTMALSTTNRFVCTNHRAIHVKFNKQAVAVHCSGDPTNG